jgi:hypothetical protein
MLFESIITADNPQIIISIEMINNIQNFYNLSSSSNNKDTTEVEKRLFENYNITKMIEEIYIFIQNDESYTPQTQQTQLVYIYDNLVNPKSYQKIDETSFIDFLNTYIKLLNLNTEIINNPNLKRNYKDIIDITIDSLVDKKKKGIKSVPSTSTSIDSVNLDNLSSILPVFSIQKDSIAYLDENDKAFIVFLNHCLFISINNVLNNSESQLLMNEFNIDNIIFLESINYALELGLTDIPQSEYLFGYINEIMIYSISNLIQMKDIVLTRGYNVYYITLGTIIDMFMSKRTLLYKIANFNTSLLFYKNGTLSTSVLFNYSL